MKELLKETLDYISELRQRYINEGRRSDEISAINDLISRIAAAPEPDVELLPDAEYGFVARYKSLTADGKTKDEAMQELARVILAAFDLDCKWVPTAMLEEAYARGYQDAFGNVKDMDYATLAAKYGYRADE